MTKKYEISHDEKVILKNNNDGSITLIPIDIKNQEYQSYLRWLENPDAEETPFTPVHDAETL